MDNITGVPGQDDVLAALDDLVGAVNVNRQLERLVLERADIIREARRAGSAYRAIVSGEHRPLIVEILRDTQTRLNDAGSRFRRAEARALRAEGLTLDQIAKVFGVTRQRVIALLRD